MPFNVNILVILFFAKWQPMGLNVNYSKYMFMHLIDFKCHAFFGGLKGNTYGMELFQGWQIPLVGIISPFQLVDVAFSYTIDSLFCL